MGQRHLLALDRVHDLFSYDPETGALVSKICVLNRHEGTCLTSRRTSIDGIKYTVADLCWFLHYEEWPSKTLDHKNRNWRDNSILNLREATDTQNQYNKCVPNPHGFKGVTWRNRIRNPWLSKIRVNGKRINLGSFPTKEEAAAAYEKACLKYHGEFACLEVY